LCKKNRTFFGVWYRPVSNLKKIHSLPLAFPSEASLHFLYCVASNARNEARQERETSSLPLPVACFFAYGLASLSTARETQGGKRKKLALLGNRKDNLSRSKKSL